MDGTNGVQLVGGPCDGERLEPAGGEPFADRLLAITVMEHAAGVAHVYDATGEQLVDTDGSRSTFHFSRTAGFRATL